MEDAMAFHVRDPETDAVVRALAKEMGTSMTEAIRITASNALRRAQQRKRCEDKRPFIARIRDIQEHVASFPKTGLKADKEFYDWLNDE
jgi:antitoxin VapB